jgi:hypothetical protein
MSLFYFLSFSPELSPVSLLRAVFLPSGGFFPILDIYTLDQVKYAKLYCFYCLEQGMLNSIVFIVWSKVVKNIF